MAKSRRKKLFRAKSYEPTESGKCPVCAAGAGNLLGVKLRYVFNPCGNDFLACLNCGDSMDAYGKEILEVK